ncbi:outer membrane beta-barrel protein [Flavobacterium sp. NRK F7]|uniref:outer membrane beta-barrel protein n=1 Tax=Flavobacterium sp. NRK F7 TaxID=2954930 RepID=UPI0020919241|nr:OmpW family outer membrane protein [Flavobacterium sp. NRK F7]MCO6162620.1 porin family protein [Flavobacterium sp. NRK F7]
MKKLLFAAVAVFAFGVANAQEESNGGFSNGDLYATGSLSISSTKMGDVKSDGYSFAPGVGYFVNENIALEAGLIVNKATMEFEGDEFEAKGFGGSVAAKYYFTPSNKFSFFAGLGVGYLTQKVGDTDTVDFNTLSVAAIPGVNYFVSDNFALQASLGGIGYSSSKFDVDGAESTNTFALGLDLTNVNFSLIYKF